MTPQPGSLRALGRYLYFASAAAAKRTRKPQLHLTQNCLNACSRSTEKILWVPLTGTRPSPCQLQCDQDFLRLADSLVGCLHAYPPMRP